jgi:hypothetical protein
VCTPWRVADPDRSRRPWGIITAQDIADPLDHAATGHPSGIRSTLDVVAVYAGGAVS